MEVTKMPTTIQVFSPLAHHPKMGPESKTEIPDLRSGVVGVLDNTKPNARSLMGQVAQAVADRIPDMQISFERKPSAAEGVSDDVRNRLLRDANLIFTGSGD
jgi:hypothetical protein